MLKQILELAAEVKQIKPLVLNITNDVTMDFIANGLLCLGASPLMAKAREEIGELINLAQTVVINIGTLDEAFIKLAAHACLVSNQLQKPIILDPVGAGASRLRTEVCMHLLKHYQIDIIRGNASEIMALGGMAMTTKGVDSTAESQQAINSAKKLSAHFNAAVIVSGATDIVVDGDTVNQYAYGSPLMPLVVGSGCLLSAVVGAFRAIEKNRLQAATAATVYYSLCGEMAAQTAKSPGSFKMHFLDALFSPNEQYIGSKQDAHERITHY